MTLWLAQPALAVKVTAVGAGPTKQSAINAAVRAAVEQALGTYMTSDTKVDKGRLDWDRITSSSAGYVKGYDVLAEGKDPVEDIFKVKLAVEVDEHKLQSFAEEFFKDARAQKAFQQTTFDNKRVIVLYARRTKGDLEYSTKGVMTIMDLVQDRLAKYGFRVFLPDQLARIKGRLGEMIIDEETAIGLARQENGDVVVVVTIDAAKQKTQDGYFIIYSTLTLKAFDCTTGELFANVQNRQKTMSQGGDYGIADGVSRVAIKVGGPASDQLVKKIVERFSGQRQKFHMIAVQNISMQGQDKLEDILNELGWKYRVNSQTGSYIEFEIFSDDDTTGVRRAFSRALKKHDLNIVPKDMKGSRVVFDASQQTTY